MGDLEAKLKDIFPRQEFSKQIPKDLKSDTTVTLRMNSHMVSALKEIAESQGVSYQFLIKDVLWRYIDSYDENREAKNFLAQKISSLLNDEDVYEALKKIHQDKKVSSKN